MYRYGQQDVTSVFMRGQGLIGVNDILFAVVMPGFFIWTGLSPFHIMIGIIIFFMLFNGMQKKGKRKGFNIFIQNWIISSAQKDSAGKFIVSVANRISNVNKNKGCFFIVKPENFRP